MNWSPISNSRTVWLSWPFEEEEIKEAVFGCDGDKAPSPDGFTAKFLQQNWDTIKGDILKVFQDIYLNGIINLVTDENYICLIPKKVNSCKISDFRPISLVTSLYKRIAIVLLTRLRSVLSEIISESQGAIIVGRQILKIVLTTNEVVEDYRVAKKEGLVFKINF